MARTITYQQAINEALVQKMGRDETVVLLGEDVAGGEGSPGEEDAAKFRYMFGGKARTPSHAEGLPGSFDVRVLAGRGHSPHMEAANECNRLIGAFVAGR